jgi:GDPmannose 4,6-dehydratase
MIMEKPNKVSLIVGSHGQDGTLLTQRLEELNYSVVGLGRGDIDLLDLDQVNKIISSIRPDEIYYLAAYHQSSENYIKDDGRFFTESFNINTIGLVNILDSLSRIIPSSKLFFASSCLVFDTQDGILQNEDSVISLTTPYAISKYAGMKVCEYYRHEKNIFVCSGILYNHESSLRKNSFVSKKIVSAVAKIFLNREEKLILGSLDSKVDWGYAPDYVEAMRLILSIDTPNDYIISSGKSRTIRDFVKIAFDHVNLDYNDYVVVEGDILGRENGSRIGDPRLLKNKTGWVPTKTFSEMVRLMVDYEIKEINSNNH